MKRNFWQVLTDKRHRVITVASVVFFISIILILSIQLYRGYENETRKAQIITKNTSHILADHVEGVFNNVDLVLTNIADIVRIRGKKFKWTAKDYQKLLYEKNLSMPVAAIVKITDANGNYVGQNEVGPVMAASLFDRAYFQTHLKNPNSGLIISDPLIGRTLKVPLLIASRRLTDEDGRFLGIVIASLPIKYFTDLFSKIDIGAHGNLTMVTMKDRLLIARVPDIVAQPGQPYYVSPEMEKVLSSEKKDGTWYAKAAFDPYNKTFNVTKNPQYNFFINNGLAAEDYLASWRSNVFWSCLSVVLLIIGFSFGLYSFLLSIEKIEKQKMQVAESAKMSTLGGMAAGIAHEINNPLAIIQSKTEAIKIALESTPANLVQIHAMLTSIDRTVYRISKIINSLRAFTRQTECDHKVETSLAQIIQNSTALIFEKYKSAAITLKVAPVPSSAVLCQEAQMIEVLFCLLSNSHDALLSQVEGRWVDIKFAEDKSKLQIIITDSGAGIPTEIAAKIMDPFFTTKPIGQGTGLGLSTAKGIIESHNGKLILNKYSNNTQFIVELPAFLVQEMKKA